ncbi:hypothetical protein Tco_0855853 [Tanacetum coccineum]
MQFLWPNSTYDSDVLSEVPIQDTYYDNSVLDQCVEGVHYSEQLISVDDSYIETISDSNVISYEQYMKQNKSEVVQDTTSSRQHNAMIMYKIEEMSNQVAKCNDVDKENKIVQESLTAELKRYMEQLKLQLSANVESHKNLLTTVDVLKKETKEKEDKHIEEIVDLEKKKKALDNIVYKMALRKQPALYYGHTIVKKHDALYVIDFEVTLELAEATRLKMSEKQNDPIVKEKRVNIKLIGYGSLNELYKHFVPKKQLSTKQAFWLPISKTVSEQTSSVQPKSVRIDIPREMPTISLVKQSFQKLKSHLDNFDKVIKVKTKVTGQNEGTWGLEHIRGAFEKVVISFVKSLRQSFHDFDQVVFK